MKGKYLLPVKAEAVVCHWLYVKKAVDCRGIESGGSGV